MRCRVNDLTVEIRDTSRSDQRLLQKYYCRYNGVHMEDITIELHLGSVRTFGGAELKFSLKIKRSGTGFLQVYAWDRTDRRKSGNVMFLNESEYNQLKAIITTIDQTILDLRQSGRMKEMRFLP